MQPTKHPRTSTPTPPAAAPAQSSSIFQPSTSKAQQNGGNGNNQMKKQQQQASITSFKRTNKTVLQQLAEFEQRNEKEKEVTACTSAKKVREGGSSILALVNDQAKSQQQHPGKEQKQPKRSQTSHSSCGGAGRGESSVSAKPSSVNRTPSAATASSSSGTQPKRSTQLFRLTDDRFQLPTTTSTPTPTMILATQQQSVSQQSTASCSSRANNNSNTQYIVISSQDFLPFASNNNNNNNNKKITSAAASARDVVDLCHSQTQNTLGTQADRSNERRGGRGGGEQSTTVIAGGVRRREIFKPDITNTSYNNFDKDQVDSCLEGRYAGIRIRRVPTNNNTNSNNSNQSALLLLWGAGAAATYAIKDTVLTVHGGRWNGATKCWEFRGEDSIKSLLRDGLQIGEREHLVVEGQTIGVEHTAPTRVVTNFIKKQAAVVQRQGGGVSSSSSSSKKRRTHSSSYFFGDDDSREKTCSECGAYFTATRPNYSMCQGCFANWIDEQRECY